MVTPVPFLGKFNVKAFCVVVGGVVATEAGGSVAEVVDVNLPVKIPAERVILQKETIGLS
jgi:hypothetical protein